MKKSVLKKEFKDKDVQRLRNLVQGKYGDKTTQSVGYTKKQEFYNEGDIWEEDGRQWTIKDGIKQNITKLDKAKESINIPLFCPSCSNLMKKKLDKRFYLQFKHCFDCQIEYEEELKIQGLWKEQDQKHVNDNVDNIINEFEVWFEEHINHSNEDFITEDGDVEKWVGGNKNQIQASKEETLRFLKSLKK